MFCLVTHIVGSNLKSKNQEVASNGCSTLLSISMKSNRNIYQHFYLNDPHFQEIWKSQSLKIFTFKKKCHYFYTGVYTGILDTPMVMYLIFSPLYSVYYTKLIQTEPPQTEPPFSNTNIISYISTLMSFRYLPDITVPSRITQISTTCIDHVLMKTSHKDKVLNVMSGLFHCEITDHLPCFLSLKFEKYNQMNERPMTRIFGEKNCAIFVQNAIV